MKKKSVMITVLAIVVVIVAGGIYMWNQKQEAEAEEAAFWEEQKPRIELYFRYNFNDVETFTYTKTDQTPMGVYIEGYINGNPDYDFSADILGGNDEFNGSVTYSSKLDEDLGKRKAHKNVDEILAEQEENGE